jgi:putative ABC transport system permease protein
VRIALGAGSLDIAAIVLGRALRLLGVGIAAGLAGGLGGAHLLRRQIWNVARFDPWSFAGVAALLLAAGLLASWWPARRAARVDPMTALRYE